MEVQTLAKNIRISPRKAKLVADLVRRQTPSQALTSLKFTTKRAGEPLSKAIASAIANAKHNFGLDEKLLKFKKLEILKGRTIKRYRFAARGRVRPILKRTTNIKVVLEAEEATRAKEPEVAKIKEAKKVTEGLEEKATKEIEETKEARVKVKNLVQGGKKSGSKS